ncbi:MAG: dicarboxylate/amino acid:cation symporter [Pseudodesulfovibrio sp.]|uniref:Sodium:dicarboxylate symporter n=1 Tax=Pseudodesulfovibrio aespoeensis (strain ATCC 700646 / DSM 10631 / Aspo-2) TaxID=643562 RepID=E6VYZ9_PSEA9|nr:MULTISPECIES: cation:dicarboxylase symporter family transporter [Pseudodesulfovibrio]MBU4378453.1 dicarboxylate/amino acid:cation symporter [Pseudomonadota bacterium]ADU61662.1 sodium:dicarboxylate symporter [Pseudodesulfovibrio aespoeensis Aspo-2]MBU4474086.1 dicarboxylate/amino acid:cation symporter [Pseudomonadota bacterium]MBU4517747.1 dicarboxylate/amino acid:cation symporter [Pseudomonadota bacterium]MBU4522179.1 dicarboxylate/amino acid:cation symporter [Pseudomonadota bacterium]
MKKILMHPLLIVIACLAGFATGVTSPELTQAIKPIGEVFLTLLNMCVLPIIICAIISSVGALFNKTKNGGSIKKMLSLYLFFIALSCIIGLATPLGMFKFFHFGDNLGATVGALMVDNDAQQQASGTTGFQSVVYDITTTATSVEEEDRVSYFLDQIVAGNIFESLASQRLLQILTFFLLFSVMLKYVHDAERELIISFSNAIFSVMQKLIDLVICFLPIGLWALLANQFSNINMEFLAALGNFVLMVWASSIIVLGVAVFFFWKATGLGPIKQATLLKAPIFIALSTRSSFPTLPAALTALDDLGLTRESTNLSVSLGHTLCKYGKSMVFCIGAIYSFYLYNVPISFFSLVSVLFLSILAGMAASGAPSIISRTMISLVLLPLGIPSEAIIIILLTVDPITDPIITLVSTYPNYAVAAMLSAKTEEQQSVLKQAA